MEKTILRWLLLSAVLFSVTASAQNYTLQIRLNDGSLKALPTDHIARIEFRQNTPPSYEGLVGHWMLIASPVGSEGEGGVYVSKTDTIRFTASMADDGSCLLCHADTLCLNGDVPLAADWSVVVEQNESDGTRRLGWVLSADTPVASVSGGQYVYLLSENINTQRLEGMTLFSDWVGDDDTTFKLPQNQEAYAVVSADRPFAGNSSALLEIWASPRFVRLF